MSPCKPGIWQEERNKELFDAIAAVLKAQPELYDQGTWGQLVPTATTLECGTRHCIAGWAVDLQGYEASRSSLGDGSSDGPSGPTVNWVDCTKNGKRETTEVVATRLLGITYGEADILFSERWRPPDGQTVAEALEAIGQGADIDFCDIDFCDDDDGEGYY